MVTGEQRRRIVFDGVAGSIGTEVADALMEMLPPEGWSDLATRQDVEHASALLKAELTGEMGSLEARLRKDISDQTRTIMIGMCSTMAAVTGVFAGLLTVFAR